MIAITGANGNLGKVTLSFLLKKTSPSNIIAVVRDPAKLNEYADSGIQIRKADYDDLQSLKDAFTGCDTILQISSAVYGEEANRQEQQVVKAAKEQGVKRIVYTSTLNPGKGKHFHAAATCGATEEAIRSLGFNYSFFRNSMYMETIPLFIGSALADGQIYYPGDNGKISFASRPDIAEALANVLLNTDAQSEVFHVTGEEAAGFEQVASLLRSEKGLNARYINMSNDAYSEILAGAGMPAAEIGFYISMADSIKADEFGATDNDLEKLLGRKRKTLQEYMQGL